MIDILEKAKNTHNLTKTELTAILKDESINQELFKIADEVRKTYVGNEVHLRGLIEFSNICRCNCKYCGLRKDNEHIERYRLTEQEIVNFAKNASEYGYKTIVMQSGEDAYFKAEILAKIIKEIKKFDVAVTLSIGEKTYNEYKTYKDAGADRYLLRIETTDQELYKQMHPNMSFENRVECLQNLKDLGYEVGTGCLVGLPNQTIESLADDILFFKEIDADMIGIGPFIPHPDTPLGENKGGSFELALKVMALTRILLPTINIPATTAMETLHPQGRILALQSGANVVMPNVTEKILTKKYEIYPNKVGITDTAKNYRAEIETKIKSIGRTISTDCGFRKK